MSGSVFAYLAEPRVWRSGQVFTVMNPIRVGDRPPIAPLLEVEGDLSIQTEITDAACPIWVHGASASTAFPARKHPFNASEVWAEVWHVLQQRLNAEVGEMVTFKSLQGGIPCTIK